MLMNKILMEDNTIDVSVIVPMYNVENLIKETIQSIKNNSCNFEVLLINDGSTDNSVSNALEAIDGDSRFILFNQENRGVSVARNRGLALATGKYVTFVDSDDLLKENAIDLLLYTALKTKSDYVYGSIKKFNSEKTWNIPVHEKKGLTNSGEKNILQNHELFYSMGPVAKLISRKLIKDNFFPEDIGCAEDQVFIYKVLVSAKKIVSLGEYIYFYRERDSELDHLSITQQRDAKAFEYYKDIIAVMFLIKNWTNDITFLTEKDRYNILSNYYERALTFDVWPLFLRVLKYHPKQSKNAFILLSELLRSLTPSFVSKVPGFRYFFIRCLIDNVFFIKGVSTFNRYRSFLILLFDKLEPEVISYFNKHRPYGNRWEDSYKLAHGQYFYSLTYFFVLSKKKEFFYWFNRNKNRLIKQYWFSLCKILPKNRDKIIFATNKSKPMGMNFTYILNELKKNDQGKRYKVYKFLGYERGLKKLLFRYYHSATAGTIFLEDYYKPYYGLKFHNKTNVIQLWHACGAFKKFAHDALDGTDSNTKEFEDSAHSFYSDVVVSSEQICTNYSSAFQKPLSTIRSFGVPRTDVFFQTEKIEAIKKRLLQKYPFLIDTHNILYAPTFRGGTVERKRFNLPIDWEKFKALPLQYKFIIKLHPVVEKITPDIPDWIKNRVMILDSKENVNDWMLFCDALVTDYSSLIFEYSLLNKPIVYFPYDLDSYFDERGFYYPYDTYIYGEVAYTSDELVQAILNAEIKYESFCEVKDNFKKQFMGSCDGYASQRIINYFFDK